MKTDRFLLFLLIGIGVLVALAVGLFLARSGTHQTYGEETTPEGVLRNYIIAVQKQDQTRAYSYLSDTTKYKPTLASFQQSMNSMQSEMFRTGVEIGAVQVNEDNTAVVSITLVHNVEGVFTTPYRDVQSIKMVRENGNWKITGVPYPYGDYSWYQDYTNSEKQPAPVPAE